MSELENALNKISEEATKNTTNIQNEVKMEVVSEVQTIEEDTVAPQPKKPINTVKVTQEQQKEETNEDPDNIGDATILENIKNAPKVPQEGEEFISDTFAKLQESMDVAEANDKGDNSVKSLLDNIKVDLSSIEIVNELDPIEEMNLENVILNDKSTKFVTCCQSSYWAELSALKSQEIQALSNSDVDYYNYKKKLYQLINRHMENTSVGKIDYGKWLHVTSFFDIDTLLYGLYCQTFNYENKYTVGCPKCSRNFDAIVNNNSLIETRGQEENLFAKIDEIISNIKNPDELLKNSQVHTTKRISLDESKIVFDIRIPSAYDYLEEVVAKSNDEQLEEYQNAIGISLFVSDIYLPNVLLYKQTGTLKYVKLNLANKGKLVNTISNLSYYDSLQLTEEINNFVEKYRISYSIRNVTCPHCGHVIKNIPLDLEDVLFNTIRRGRIDK